MPHPDSNHPRATCRLSIVIPMFNEEKRIGATLDQIATCMRNQGFPWEILAVDDGSRDGTRQAVDGFMKEHPSLPLRLLGGEHRGKGHAVKTGMIQAGGELILFTDADLSTPIEEIERFLPFAEQGTDIVIGSREAPGARRHGEPAQRHLVGRAFNFLVRTFTVRGLGDTQCGFKLFRREAARLLFTRLTLEQFGFDVEILHMAQKYGLQIRELPVEWYYGTSSTVHIWQDGLRMGLDVVRVLWNDLMGRYECRPS